MKIVVHADDFALSEGICDSIIKCHTRGLLHGTSILANGVAFDYGVSLLKNNPSLRITVHLNLFEGRPLIPESELTLITDSKGFFHHSFYSLWKSFLLSNAARRAELKRQVKLELEAQIQKISDILPEGGELRVDGHQHCHMIPFVFDLLMDLHKSRKISRVRIPSEALSIAMLIGHPPPAMNILKVILLNHLSKAARARLRQAEIFSNSDFLGVLYSGVMQSSCIKKALKKILDRGSPAELEILFHPCVPRHDELWIWERYPSYIRYYWSKWRQAEVDLLLSQDFLDLINSYERAS